jgi:hypothetical protein
MVQHRTQSTNCARRGLFLAFALLAMLLLPLSSFQGSTVRAQDTDATPAPTTDTGPRFVIRPADGVDGDYFTLEAEAGTTNELVVVLGNADDEDLVLRTYVNDAVPMTNGGFSIADEESAPTGTATWIDYPAETFTFKPGEGVERTFTVTIPEDAEPGQYIAGLALQTAEPLEVEGTSMFNQIIRKSIAVFIIVPGPEEPSFELGEPALVTDGAISRIEIPLANTGNVLVKPQGELTLANADGDVVLSAPIIMGSVYAGTTVPLVVGLTADLPEGDYTLAVDLNDEATGASDTIDDFTLTLSAASTAAAQFSMTADVVLSPDNVAPAFATVNVTIENQGNPANRAEVLLDVMKDGEVVETFTLAASLALPQGTTQVSQRYIPPTGWESGSWSFVLRLNVIDESTNVSTTVVTLDSLPAIEVGK